MNYQNHLGIVALSRTRAVSKAAPVPKGPVLSRRTPTPTVSTPIPLEDDVDQIMTKASKSEVNASINIEPLEHPKEDKGKTIILVEKLPVPILREMTHQISSCNFPPKPN